MRLPNFLILGANKAGTTALTYYCAQHPEIFISPIKEPMFFTVLHGTSATRDEATLKKPFFTYYFDEYLELFSGAKHETILGEGSTSYLANPSCAVWIRKIIPNVKLIAILRDPFDRALSCYKMYNGNGIEKRTFEEAIKDELENGTAHLAQGQQYLKLGLYGSQLTQFLNFFPSDQIFITDYSKFNENSVLFLESIFEYLGVKSFVPKDLKRMNTAMSNYREPQNNDMFFCSSRLRYEINDYFKEDIRMLNEIVPFNALEWLL